MSSATIHDIALPNLKMMFSRVVALFGCLSLTFPLLASDIVMTEVMYHPSSENVLEEYIELYNHGPTNVSLLN